MLTHFGDTAKGVWGKWVAGKNLDMIDELTAQGVLLEEAVTRTWTANRARDFGFGKSAVFKDVGSPGVYTNVEVKFAK